MTNALTGKRAVGFRAFSEMFDTSLDQTKRLARDGYLRTIYIGGRRLVPWSEVERAEREGIGNGRKRRTPRGKAQPEVVSA